MISINYSRKSIAALAFMVVACQAVGQVYRPKPRTRIIDGEITGGNVSLQVNGNSETRNSYQTGTETENNLLSVMPSIGLSVEGSIYHPNLLSFTVSGHEGIAREFTTEDISPENETLFHTYSLQANILRAKPYQVLLYANRSVTRRSYGFFTYATVEDINYGGYAGYTLGRVPVSIEVDRLQEESVDSARPTTRDDGLVVVRASHDRNKSSRTKMTYKLRDFETRRADTPSSKGVNHILTVVDRESFGDEDRFRLHSSLNCNILNRSTYDSLRVRLQEGLRARHKPNLNSHYRYGLDYSDNDSSSSTRHRASASVTHRLYESLRSSVSVNGELRDISSTGSDVETYRYGAGIRENYVKKLGEWGRLNLYWEAGGSQGQNRISGESLRIIDESVVLTDGVVSLLNEANVDSSTIVITDSSGTIVYSEMFDYRVAERGSGAEIERIPTGLIPDGATVLVSYTAFPDTSDAFSSRRTSTGFRVDIASGLLSVYGRRHETRNDAGSSITVHDLVDSSVGASITRGIMQVGLEYREYGSSLTPYTSVRTYQKVSFNPSDRSVLTFDANQVESEYPDTGDEERRYTYIGRYRARLWPSVAFNAEAGLRTAEGSSIDRDLITARASLVFAMGRLETRCGYEYRQDDDRESEFREEHVFYLRAKRLLF